jgi:hypothetical protein
VSAYDAAGNESAQSASLSFTTKPSAPISLDIKDISSTGATIIWGGSTNSTITYEIERSMDGINFTKIADVVGALSYTDNSLAAGSSYYYQIRASNDGGTSDYVTSSSPTTTSPPPAPVPPQTGLRLWLKADAGITTDNGQVVLWQDQSASQAHAVVPQGGIGPRVSNTSDLGPGFTTIEFDGQTDALELPPFMEGATGAIVYIVVKSEKTNNPLWSMGATGTITLYPGTSGQIEDDFASTTVHTTRETAPPLKQWHVYQVTSVDGAWWPALDQELLPTKKDLAVATFAWSDTCTLSVMPGISVDYLAGSGTDSALPALLPESGYLFNATVQAENSALSDNYFGLSFIGLKLQDDTLKEYPTDIGEFLKAAKFDGGTAQLTLTLDEVETFIGASLRDNQITRITLELESAILNSGTFAGASNFQDNYDIKTTFAIPGTEVKNQYEFTTLPAIGGGFKGEIAEILIYDETADIDESVNKYLQSKYGLIGNFKPFESSLGDGIPDVWKIRNGLDPLDPSVLDEDADGTGATWRQKYQLYLDSLPTDESLGLKIFTPNK